MGGPHGQERPRGREGVGAQDLRRRKTGGRNTSQLRGRRDRVFVRWPNGCLREDDDLREGNACAKVARGRDGSLKWRRLRNNKEPDCPYPSPQVGSSCTRDGIVCDYGACWDLPGGSRVACDGGIW